MATAQNYLVCSTVRSGSTLLCKTLEGLEACGQPREYFHRHTIAKLGLDSCPDRFLRYCQDIFQESLAQHGVFGIKMHWWQLFDFLRLAKQSPAFATKPDLEILNSLFPNLQFIYLWRENLLAQAVSAAIATQTGHWEKRASSHYRVPPKFQPWRIYEWEQALAAHNQCWQQFFQQNGLSYHQIVYEDLVQSFPQQIQAVIHYIGASELNQGDGSADIKMPTQRQSSRLNRRFIRYYQLFPKPVLRQIYQLYRQAKPAQEGVTL